MTENELFGNSEQLEASYKKDHVADPGKMVGDLISRKAALDALGEEPLVWYDGEDEIAERNQWRRDVAAIKALPSAQPNLSEAYSKAVFTWLMDYQIRTAELNGRYPV